MDFAPAADFDLLLKAYKLAKKRELTVHVGGILSVDMFYRDNPDEWKLWAAHGTLAVEMETNTLYTLAAKHQIRAFTVLTVSDSLPTGETATAEQREKDFPQMAKIALEIAP
jgi:purine-nucleoside phosphorylase